jgi:rubrerythrin
MDDLEILGRALKLEQDGESFYQDAARTTTDDETRNAYLALADDETFHATFIKRQLDALTDGNGWQIISELENTLPIDMDAPIFEVNVKVRETLPEKATEEDALLFALGAEVRTYTLYMDGARRAAPGPGRDMYLKLAKVERGHFELLMTRYEARFGYPR